jgi:hypothetical protein
MSKTVYRFQFEPEVPIEEAETSLIMAIIAAEALHGQPAVRLSMRYLFGEEKRVCVIDGDNDVARQVVMIFTQFLIHQFGEDAFQITQPARERSAAPAPVTEAEPAAAAQADAGGAGCGACKACGKEVPA